MGLTGSDTAASGCCFSRRQRVMYFTSSTACSSPAYSSKDTVKNPTRSSWRRGVMGRSGSRTMLWWSSTVTAPWLRSRRAPRPLRGGGEFPDNLYVTVTLDSMLRGKQRVLSMKVRFLSAEDAPRRRRALNSGRSPLNRSETSMTGARPLPQALTGRVAMMGSREVAATDKPTVSSRPARILYFTSRSRTSSPLSTQRTTRFPTAVPP